MKTLNSSIKHHIIIGSLIGIWGFLFAFFSRPFEHGMMDLQKWFFVSIGFSFSALICYILVSLLQNFFYNKIGSWNWFYEIAIYVSFYFLFTTITYFYYKSPIIVGYYPFFEFFKKIILNLILITTPLIFFLRMYAYKLIPEKGEDLTIRGENKLDILRIKRSELVCISNSHNYVEIFYLEGTELKSKLIRSSLKKMHSDHSFLLQTHRSHLINLSHFKCWKDSSTVSLTQIEIPVSKNYKEPLLGL